MRKLPKPTEFAIDVFNTCISRVENNNLKNRLSACANNVAKASLEFDIKVSPPQLHTILQESLVNGDVTVEEMKKVYTERMVPKDSPGRSIYEKLLATPVHGICPLCSHNKATTLDHHLAKALYPCLSVVPFNLIPSCKDCNKLKNALFPRNAEQETLHPYYDDIENILWLDAVVQQTSPPVLQYFVNPPADLDNTLKVRIKYHFDSLSLNLLYSDSAAAELDEIKFQLSTIYNSLGASGIRAHLLEAEETRRQVNANSWKTVMYRVLGNNVWFCDNGW